MMRSGERTAEGCTSLAIAHIGVGEEYGGRSGKAVSQLAGFAYEAILYLYAVDDAGAFSDDAVFCNNACADIYVAMS